MIYPLIIKECPKCKVDVNAKNMIVKMGGLLCPKCRTILYRPYVDKEYFKEVRRRRKESGDL